MSANRLDALREFISRPTTNHHERANAQRALDSMTTRPALVPEPAPRAVCWAGVTGPDETVRVEMASLARAKQALGEPMVLRWGRKYWAVDTPQTLDIVCRAPRAARSGRWSRSQVFVVVPIKRLREARPSLAGERLPAAP